MANLQVQHGFPPEANGEITISAGVTTLNGNQSYSAAFSTTIDSDGEVSTVLTSFDNGYIISDENRKCEDHSIHEATVQIAFNQNVETFACGGYNPNFDIFVKKLNGRTVTIKNVSETTTVETLKKCIQSNVEDIPPNQQRLLFGSKQLEEHKSLGDYDIQNGSTIHLLLRLRGG